ncbi:MAG: hypothetical protein FJ333_06100, partial [Sphingomonadales bacterium]|nr:hypothetical protein [Sphingomonadales bacterium]
MKILHISAFDKKGGAAAAAYRIFEAISSARDREEIKMLCFCKESKDSRIITMQGIPSRIASKFILKVNRLLVGLSGSKRDGYRSCALFGTGIGRMAVALQTDYDIINLQWL